MRYLLIGLICFCLSLSAVRAQDIPDDPKAPPGKLDEKQLDKEKNKEKAPKQEILELKEIVKGQNSLSKRIFFIIDVSGSMKGDGKIGKAIKFVRTIWQSPVDEFEIAVAVFSDNSVRWEGFPSAKDDPHPAPKGWAKLPSKDAIDAAQKFLDGYPGDGSTYPTPALEMALKEDRSDLSIVFVTDGDYSGSTQGVLDDIKKLQDAREKKGLGKAVISVFGVGDAEKQKNLSEIGKDYLGGFYIEKLPEVKRAGPEEKKDSSSHKKVSLVVPDDSVPPAPEPDNYSEDSFEGFPHRHSEHWLYPPKRSDPK